MGAATACPEITEVLPSVELQARPGPIHLLIERGVFIVPSRSGSGGIQVFVTCCPYGYVPLLPVMYRLIL